VEFWAGLISLVMGISFAGREMVLVLCDCLYYIIP